MIIVFGSNILDLFFHVDDLPASGKAVHYETHIEAAGGKGQNQAVAAARAGAQVKFYGAVGSGGHGRQLIDNMAKNNVDVLGVAMLDDHPTGLATIFVGADGDHKVVVSQGANLHAKASQVPDDVLLPHATVLLQGELPMAETESLIKRAKAKGCRLVMNLAPPMQQFNPHKLPVMINNDALAMLDVLIVNQHEADVVAQKLGWSETNYVSLAQRLSQHFDLTAIVTLGKDGALAATTDKKTYQVNALKVEPLDMLGAGDAFVGYLTAALDTGLPLEEALRHGSIAGALTCTAIGAQAAVPYPADVVRYLSALPPVKVTAAAQAA